MAPAYPTGPKPYPPGGYTTVCYPYSYQQQQQCAEQQCHQPPYGYAAVPPQQMCKTRKAAAKLANWMRSKQGKAVQEGAFWGGVLAS